MALSLLFLLLATSAKADPVATSTATAYTSPASDSTGDAVDISASQTQTVVIGSTAPINIIYPKEGDIHPATRGARIMGWVSHPGSHLRINGQNVRVHPLGGFLAYLPIVPGTFTFHCELDLPDGTTSLNRTILVTVPLKADATNQTVIDPDPMQPGNDIELRPGDWLTVEMKGTPSGHALFQIEGKRQKFPMTEVNSAMGIYRGAYQLQPDDLYEAVKIYFYLTGPNRSSTWTTAKGRLTVRAGLPSVAVVRSNNDAHVRVERGAAFLLFPPIGTKFLTVGHDGPETRLWLNSSLLGAIPTSTLRFLPPGTPLPHATLGTIKTEAATNCTVVTFNLTDTIPYLIEPGENPDTLLVRFFYTVNHTNWIVYDPVDSFIRDIRWKQEASDTASVTIHLTPSSRLWGYHAQWDNGSLRLELRHPPVLPRNGSVLKGLTVILDPGHMPSAPGAAGPRGVLEKDVNAAIAKSLERLLRKAGANPMMTRDGDAEVGLADRPHIARDKHGELFISIHNNSMPDGEDPFDHPVGFTIFYYHPHSLEFGQAVHRGYQRNIHLPDEGLRYGDLLVARLTDMPAILTESAYMILPDQEVMLSSPVFQRRLAQAMFEGIRNFMESERRRQWYGNAASPRRLRK